MKLNVFQTFWICLASITAQEHNSTKYSQNMLMRWLWRPKICQRCFWASISKRWGQVRLTSMTTIL